MISFSIWAANISILTNTRPKMAIFYTIWTFAQKLCQKKLVGDSLREWSVVISCKAAAVKIYEL